MPESWPTRLTGWGFNLYPAYWGTGARITYVASDYAEVRVRLPLSWRTRNYVGTIFGRGQDAADRPPRHRAEGRALDQRRHRMAKVASQAAEFLAGLPPDRRKEVERVRAVVRYAALAAQKNCLPLYLMMAYGDVKLAGKLKNGFKAAGKKLDMRKSCVRFTSADGLALDVVGELIASTPVEKWVEVAKAARHR